MQMFKVHNGAITRAEIAKVSEDSVWEVALNGAETRKARTPKTDKQPAFFDTLEEAKASLLSAAREGVEHAAKRLEAAKARYQQIQDMQVV